MPQARIKQESLYFQGKIIFLQRYKAGLVHFSHRDTTTLSWAIFLNEGLYCQKEANVIARFCLTERKRFNVGANWDFKFPAKIRKKNQAALKWTHAPIFHIDSVSNICSSFPVQNTHAPIWKKIKWILFSIKLWYL